MFPLFYAETPILGGAKVPMMRRSTIKALETRRDEVITERKQQGKMRTLGASNPHNNNKDKHRDGRHAPAEVNKRTRL